MSRRSEPNPVGASSKSGRVALWYAIEEAFGGLLRDEMAEPYWTPELDALEERVRKRLRVLELAQERHIPDVVKAFIVEHASPDGLIAVAEEAMKIAVQSRRVQPQPLRQFMDQLEMAINDAGIELTFDDNGKLVKGPDVDTAPKAIKDLPPQTQFKEDLAAQSKTQVALIFADLDNFKAVNDTKGHPAGDACLVKIVEVIGGVIVPKGKLYRYGGDEFVVILQNADVDEAAATGERIRRAIESAKPGGDIEVTASIGVAASDQAGLNDPEALLKAADRATYASKENGKNRVTKWADSAVSETDRANRRKLAERIARLVELAEFGIHKIQNDPQNDSAPTLEAKRHAWEAEVLEALTDAGATQTELSSFRVIGTYKAQGLPGKTAHYKKIVNEVAEKIVRLRAILADLERRQRSR